MVLNQAKKICGYDVPLHLCAVYFRIVKIGICCDLELASDGKPPVKCDTTLVLITCTLESLLSLT